ncbi:MULTISPECIES: LLM class flavin-dependent oxidoreductase [unclassified Microbacterium]|uniref:LLM class flavin-dependent oxidoreductase n=1 Tax=unclassified Microbacterium TaxID=2609290 RepID=UPI00214BDBF8|nr:MULTISPECIES: LLM class flavin-dependent oxidoreductase [unclassified Microbacterium]MCR2808731.1 LLM class flavin-dependent oxidoreductase [Microbacterium sp. zg.B185]WIM18839.1 LLM class flavin-dependent oxidoreductase [Microbacterium sp. zg-B185]
MTERATVSLGVAASVGPELAGRLAPAVEEAGFSGLWVNDTPAGDAFPVLQAAARATSRLILATGILPIDRRPAGAIVAETEARALPQERLVLGIGSGQITRGALTRVGAAASELRDAVSARVVVGALGPKMRRLAVEASDGVLLSWLTPATARAQAAEARSLAPLTHVALYVRTALDPDARGRLQVETERYAAVPAYAANFARQGVDPARTVWDAGSEPDRGRLDDYRTGADEVILRAITAEDTLSAYLRFVERARALL